MRLLFVACSLAGCETATMISYKRGSKWTRRILGAADALGIDIFRHTDAPVGRVSNKRVRKWRQLEAGAMGFS